MNFEEEGMKVHCKGCELTDSNDAGSFQVIVPIEDPETQVSRLATLLCHIKPQEHQIELIKWTDGDDQVIEVTPQTQLRLTVALKQVEELRLCGNQSICPSDVVKYVEQYT